MAVVSFGTAMALRGTGWKCCQCLSLSVWKQGQSIDIGLVDIISHLFVDWEGYIIGNHCKVCCFSKLLRGIVWRAIGVKGNKASEVHGSVGVKRLS